MVSLYNILTDTPPPRARPGPPRPSLASGGPPAAARCGGVTNPTTEHRDAVGRSEVQLCMCIAHPGLYHLDPSTGACGAVDTKCCSHSGYRPKAGVVDQGTTNLVCRQHEFGMGHLRDPAACYLDSTLSEYRRLRPRQKRFLFFLRFSFSQDFSWCV